MTCLTVTADTLEILANSLHTPFLEALSNTTQSLLKNIEVNHSNECTSMMNLMEASQTVKQNKNNCIELMEQTHELLNAIIIIHIKSDTGGELPPSTLNHIGKFTEYFPYSKIHTSY